MFPMSVRAITLLLSHISINILGDPSLYLLVVYLLKFSSPKLFFKDAIDFNC